MRAWLDRRRIAREAGALVAAHHAHGSFSGAALVEVGGRTLLRVAAGRADFARGIPNRPETAFRIGSVAKTLTALGVLRLVDRGRLGLDDPLARFVPGFPEQDRLLLRHLLSNTSGLADFLLAEELAPRLALPHAPDQVIEYVRTRPLLFEPGARLGYSNTNWTLLAMVLERVIGRSFPDALRELVLEPLRLRYTFVDSPAPGPDAALGYTLVDSGPVPAAPIDPSVERGAGGVRSTVDDLLRLDHALRGPGFLTGPTLEAMARPVAYDGAIGYGLGLFLTSRFGRPSSGHSGGTFGFTAFWSRYPADDVTVVVLANLDNGTAERLERELAAVVFGEPYQPLGAKTFVTVDPALLERYAGSYRSAFAGRRIDFAVEFDGRELYAAFPLLPRARLRALGEARFFTRLKGGDVIFEFVQEGDRIAKIAVDWSGTVMDCPRLS